MLTDSELQAFIAQLDGAVDDSARIEIRSAARREIGLLIVPWERPVMTRNGPEVFMRGAFDGLDPSKVVLRLEHENPPAGRGIEYEDRADGAYMVFRVSKTTRGDDILTLAEDGTTPGASVGFKDIPGGVQMYRHGGKSLRVVHRADLKEVSTTWQPTWQEAGVQFVRSEDAEGDPVTEAVADVAPVPAPAPVSAPAIDITPLTAMFERALGGQDEMARRLDAIEERSRGDFRIPDAIEAVDTRARQGVWMQTVLQMMTGARISEQELKTRALDDLITSDNIGVVPDGILQDTLIGVIDPARPFLNSTRKLPDPGVGMQLTVPKIVTRPETGIQAEEKDELASNTTSITNVSFDAMTIGGAGDISLQLLKRSSPSYLALYLELLAESYAHNSETEAIKALLAGGVSNGGALDPEAANFGAAWVNGAAVRKTPDTIWLSAEGVAAFINAKADGTNAPLYSSIQSGFTAGSGPAGSISGLRPVYLPELDAASTTVDAIVGPSAGFGWTEDGTYTLQVDVPAKAGRDVAIVGMLWFAPMYPSAFTKYTIAS